MNLIKHINRQIIFSIRNFGPGKRTLGLIDHIKKELNEIQDAPDDLEEWIDVILLAIDGAWRSGHTDKKIVDGLDAKLLKNEKRTYPDWRTADPNKAIEHIRS